MQQLVMWNQAGRRKGSIAVYVEPWHADIMDFLELRLNQGDEEARCRDLFSALWIPDLFMKRVEENGQWSLFCPDKAPGLSDAVGEEFEALYTKYEEEGLANCNSASYWSLEGCSQVSNWDWNSIHVIQGCVQ